MNKAIKITLSLAVSSLFITPFFIGSEVSAQSIPEDELFGLSSSERAQFTPPSSWDVEFDGWWHAFGTLWNAFNEGKVPDTVDPTVGPNDWYEADGIGSQNHSLVWLGSSVIGHALNDNPEEFDVAAQNALRVLALDRQQGHMRHEAIGSYANQWAGGIAMMALGAYYAPEDSLYGDDLLRAARHWWADHIAVLRKLRMPDGQVALIGARTQGEEGAPDLFGGLSVSLTLQMADPISHNSLHPYIASLITPSGKPDSGTSGIPVQWHRPLSVWRWVVLRAFETGALTRTSSNHPTPPVAHPIYRWQDGNEIHVAAPEPVGYPAPAIRWHAVWSPGEVVKPLAVGDFDGGKGPHKAWDRIPIPDGLAPMLGPGNSPTPPPDDAGSLNPPSESSTCPIASEKPTLMSSLEIRDKKVGDRIEYEIEYSGEGDIEVGSVSNLPYWLDFDSLRDEVVGRIPADVNTNQTFFTVNLESSEGGVICEESHTRVSIFWDAGDSCEVNKPILDSPIAVRNLDNGDRVEYQIESSGLGQVSVDDVRGLPWWLNWDSETNMVSGRIPENPVTNQVSFTVDLESSKNGTGCSQSSTRVTIFWDNDGSQSDNDDDSGSQSQLSFKESLERYGLLFSDEVVNTYRTESSLEDQGDDSENAYTLNRPPQTIAEIRAFQCAYNIVCEGSIATTGFGNMGPKTRAKVNEVFGTGSVYGTQSGMTIQEMQELIAELLQQVAELRAQLNN